MVSRLGGRSGWVRVAVVFRRLHKRAWAVSADVIRDIIDELVGEGVLVERVFRPSVGRPSPEVRFSKGVDTQ